MLITSPEFKKFAILSLRNTELLLSTWTVYTSSCLSLLLLRLSYRKPTQQQSGLHCRNLLKSQQESFKVVVWASQKASINNTRHSFPSLFHSVDARGQAVRINYNNATRDTVFDIPAEKVRPFYAALKEFNDLLNSTEHKFTCKLKPGQ